MISATVLTLVDGTQIVVPDSLDLITPYVLQEQQDWFEDEIKFLRCLLQPGQMAIDIGANYGVYTLSIAKTVGASGHVWAFEPSSSTAGLLAEGIAVNAFSQVVLERSALSSTTGTAELSITQHAELNALVRGEQATVASETVPLVTLDHCMEAYGWQDIDFVKIDAEGEEANILKGGKKFFSQLSPLVQYEIKAGADLHMDLVEAFGVLGYESYRLVPGLDLMIPFSADLPPDDFLLNLFCCKPDRAAHLAAQGFLINAVTNCSHISEEGHASNTGRNDYDCCYMLAKLPYGKQLSDVWAQTIAAGDRDEVEAALSLYLCSQDLSLSATERFHALEASFIRLSILCEHQPSHLRLASLARVARDYGARGRARIALAQLSDMIFRDQQIDLSEPFLAPVERFDWVDPGEAIFDWVMAAVLEGFELLSAFSSFYTKTTAKKRLELIHSLGFGGLEMQRRLSLIRQRFDQSSPSE